MEKTAPFLKKERFKWSCRLPSKGRRKKLHCSRLKSGSGCGSTTDPHKGWVEMTAPFLKKERLNSGPAARPLKGGWGPDRLKITSSSKSGMPKIELELYLSLNPPTTF